MINNRYDPGNLFKSDQKLYKTDQDGRPIFETKLGECEIVLAMCDHDCRMCSFAMAHMVTVKDWKKKAQQG